MDFQRTNSHSVSRLTAHIVWVTKYRYPVLEGDIKIRCRMILIQICEAEDIQILKGVVSKDHVHMHIEYRPSQDISSIVKLLKGRSSRKLQMEISALKTNPTLQTFSLLNQNYGLQVHSGLFLFQI